MNVVQEQHLLPSVVRLRAEGWSAPSLGTGQHVYRTSITSAPHAFRMRELNEATILEALAFLGCSRRFILPDCIIFLSDSLILRFVRGLWLPAVCL